MKYLFLLVALIFSLSFLQPDKIITVNKAKAKNAFTLLNTIRANPLKFYEELHFDKTLKVANKKLIWNDTLARVAETKALDMANRNYFGHIDPDGFGINYFMQQAGYKLNPGWTKEKNANYFESLVTNLSSGETAIKTLIIDKGVPSFGHRTHLLGTDPWNASLIDIGIGFVKKDSADVHNTITCVIIAKHNW